MKILQICGGNTDQGGDEGRLFGLGDDGNLYEFRDAYKGSAGKLYTPVSEWKDGMEKDGWIKPATSGAYIYNKEREHHYTTVYKDGWTAGWHLLVTSDHISKPVPHPEDPTRHERF